VVRANSPIKSPTVAEMPCVNAKSLKSRGRRDPLGVGMDPWPSDRDESGPEPGNVWELQTSWNVPLVLSSEAFVHTPLGVGGQTLRLTFERSRRPNRREFCKFCGPPIG
jgi:hypothetical protein